MNKECSESQDSKAINSIGRVSRSQFELICAALDREPSHDHVNRVLPPLWHWCAFPPKDRTDQLGFDGHPHEAERAHTVSPKRRMWAGGKLKFFQAIGVGDKISRVSRVKDRREKVGRTGPMTLLTLEHELRSQDRLVIHETQDIIYLDFPKTFRPPERQKVLGNIVNTITMSETRVFRYSAVTYNAHRIHYDVTYARDVEKYPALVVQGPLQATLLMQEAIKFKGLDSMPIHFEFRSVFPMFVGSNCDISLECDGTVMKLWTSQDGHQCMQATALWEPGK